MDPQGSDDFSDMRLYRPGDPVRHIVWRIYARSDQLVVKEYTSYLDPRLLLDLRPRRRRDGGASVATDRYGVERGTIGA